MSALAPYPTLTCARSMTSGASASTVGVRFDVDAPDGCYLPHGRCLVAADGTRNFTRNAMALESLVQMFRAGFATGSSSPASGWRRIARLNGGSDSIRLSLLVDRVPRRGVADGLTTTISGVGLF